MTMILERQRRLMEMKLQAKKLKKEGKFDELARLLGSSAANAENLSKRLGENRENYINKLNERWDNEICLKSMFNCNCFLGAIQK